MPDSQKVKILRRLLEICKRIPTNLAELNKCISNIEGSLSAIDDKNFDPINNEIYDLSTDLEQLYAIKIDINQELNLTDIKEIEKTLRKIRKAIKKIILTSRFKQIAQSYAIAFYKANGDFKRNLPEEFFTMCKGIWPLDSQDRDVLNSWFKLQNLIKFYENNHETKED